jgi:bifunctional DNA-binding transcriptional regulator/antitoxin component of YhaV-PrlF toxin-antitoxin module
VIKIEIWPVYFIVKIRNRGMITIPITVRESLKLRTGDIVEIDIKKIDDNDS